MTLLSNSSSHPIEATISNLVKNQFPTFYQSEGPNFVAFVTEYYKWLEGTQEVANSTYAEAKSRCKIDIIAGNTTVVATTKSLATFEKCFESNSKIAIYTNVNGTDYNLYTVNTVVNNSVLTLTTAPDFTLTNTRFSTVKTQINPVKFLRDFYKNQDVDETIDDFLVYFKEKYLKNIRFDTFVDKRRMIKHSLDIYRSKGTERSVDLLFKMVYGVPSKVYYPGDDIFRTSDGQWLKPKYLEVNLSPENVKLINKQIYGFNSGATAFVESVVRKTVNGRLIDVLYISALNGNFQVGELINSSDNVLVKDKRSYIIGSLTEVDINPNYIGSGFSVGDLLDVVSESGTGAKARVSNVITSTGVVNLELENGGYGYTSNANVIISDNVLIVNNLILDTNYIPVNNSYFSFLQKIEQPLVVIEFENASNTLNLYDEIFTYYGNGDVQGHGRIIDVDNIANVLTASVFTGNLNSDFYTTGNAVAANVLTYTDISKKANIMKFSSNVRLHVSNVTGTFVADDIITQGYYANSKLTGFTLTIGSNGTISTSNVQGVFRSNSEIVGSISGATATVESQEIRVGVINNISDSWITTTNNYIVIANTVGSTVSGTLTAVSTGNGFNFNLGSIIYSESVDVNSDYIFDYYNYPLTHVALTGTLDVNTSSNVIIGTGTDFENEIGYTITGNVSMSTTANVIIGTGTDFENEIVVGDILGIDNQAQYVKVREVVNSTFLLVNSAAIIAVADVTATKNQYITITDGTNIETHQVLSITNSTVLELVTTPGFSNSSATATRAWGFPGNTSANLTNDNIESILSNTSITIGKISSLTNINPGSTYSIAPMVTIYEPLVKASNKPEYYILDVENVSGSFTINEAVEQIDTSARGVVVFANTSTMILERLRLNDINAWSPTTNSTTLIEGISSGATANILNVYESADSNNLFPYLGLNANVLTTSFSGIGGISKIEIINSGFGFKNGEEVTLIDANSLFDIRGTSKLIRQGQGEGLYLKSGGLLSSSKKLFDGFYYQDFSYEIRSSVLLNTYEDMLKQLIHVAGTQYFGGYIYNSINNTQIMISESNIIQS